MARRKPIPKAPEPDEHLPEIQAIPEAPTDEDSSPNAFAPPGPEKAPEPPKTHPKNMAWLCRCGQRFPETGSATGYGRWANHLSQRQPGCRGEGLIDVDTGEILVFWRGSAMLTLQDAIHAGYMPRKEERDRMRAQERVERGSSPDGRDGAPRNLEAVVPLERISLPAWVWALKLSTDPVLLRPDGTPYGWSSEDKAEWLADLLEIGWHAVMLQDPARALGVPPDQAEQLVRQGFLDRLLALLKGIPESQLQQNLQDQLGRPVYETVVPAGPAIRHTGGV